MMGYIECPKCGKLIDEICMDYEFSLDGREPTDAELLEYLQDCQKWVEKERTCKESFFESVPAGCGHVWTPEFEGSLIQNFQHTRIYLSHHPKYGQELLKQDCPLSAWMRSER